MNGSQETKLDVARLWHKGYFLFLFNFITNCVVGRKYNFKQNESIYFPDATEKVMSMKKFHFFLEPDNLVIYFPLYEIAPYSSGIPQFRIPYTLLRDYLKPSYQNILIDNK